MQSVLKAAKNFSANKFLYFNDVSKVDLTKFEYDEKSTSGAGAYPKWFINDTVVKINNVFGNGIRGNDGVNECFVYDLFNDTSIKVAPCYPIHVTYQDKLTSEVVETCGMIAPRFIDEHIYASRLVGEGSFLKRVIQADPIGFLHMMVLDYITGQTDRHPSNWAYYKQDPMRMFLFFDNGKSLGYNRSLVINNNAYAWLTTSKTPLDFVLDILTAINCQLFDIVNLDAFEDNLDKVYLKYLDYYEDFGKQIRGYLSCRFDYLRSCFK